MPRVTQSLRLVFFRLLAVHMPRNAEKTGGGTGDGDRDGERSGDEDEEGRDDQVHNITLSF